MSAFFDPARAYHRHGAFAAPALQSPELWRILLGLTAIEAIFALAIRGFDAALDSLAPALAIAVFEGTTPAGLMVQLASYGFLGLATAFVTERLHHRPARSLIGARGQGLRLMTRGFLGAMTFYMVVQFMPPWSDFAAIEEIRPAGPWLLALPLALAALLVQTASEELLYRGYLQQQIAARFAHPAIWMVVPNLIFASVHWNEGSGWADNWQYVIWAFCFGLACSDLTARAGNLGPAIGLHLANNAYAFLFFGEVGGLDSGLSLFLFPATPEMPDMAGAGADGPILTLMLALELFVLALAWLSARLAIRR